ncbi:tRNA (adenine(22)-N(1))-methyltransferase TrmK [Halalkalibacillus sediminis]|uniref:tRNA (Adenine(22)-N(1))-methyltransferase TrmK n=1 Tax=Halalkalibacillus sediminis TaxID=2018042 RepID=A0A2I0QXG6_9BACI|nr:tRNA (adenine(22)-N(1))-methyltransferase TrmK [Halalkalibacillus sediminis]PKR79014.1 tRNA (adenine(22)-N(1))-methyltransferase TrmK [Halalkalibacillus sediminis]
MVELSKRLQNVAEFIPVTTRKFADIGSDHAYLPCYICENNKNTRAIAGEVNQGPHDAALRQVQSAGLQDRIEVRLGDGLGVISPNEVDCVTIAGMGGTLISNILTEQVENLSGVDRLVLQPNIDASSIRMFAKNFQWQIVNEKIFEDDGYIYEILVLEPQESLEKNLTEKEMYLGPILMREKNEAFYKKWEKVLDKKINIIEQMKNAKQIDEEKVAYFSKQTEWIKEEIHNE